MGFASHTGAGAHMPEDPNAQGQQAAAETPSAQAQERQEGNGVEQRIGELTAKFRDAERAAAEKDKMIAELTAVVSQMTATQAGNLQTREASHEEVPELDPDVQRALDSVVSSKMRRVEEALARLEAQAYSQQLAPKVSRFSGDPEVKARADQYMKAWRQNGYTGWRPEDAITYAVGDLAMEGKIKLDAVAGEREQMNAGATPITGHSRAPVAASSNQRKPADFDSWDPGKQLEWIEKQYPNGIPI